MPSQSIARRRPGQAGVRGVGFTLIELVVVIGVLGIIVGATIPLFRGTLSRMKARGILQEVVLTLRLAHQRSVFRQETQDFVVDFRNHKYWVEALAPGKHTKRLRKRAVEVRRLPHRFEFLAVYYQDTEELEDRRKTRFFFYPDGTATDAAILVGKVDLTGESEFEQFQVIRVRGTDGKATVVEDEADVEWYLGLL